jgi:hypothetical protein
MKTVAAAALGILLAIGQTAAGEPAPPQRVNFTTKPTAAKDGENVKISFAVELNRSAVEGPWVY